MGSCITSFLRHSFFPNAVVTTYTDSHPNNTGQSTLILQLSRPTCLPRSCQKTYTQMFHPRMRYPSKRLTTKQPGLFSSVPPPRRRGGMTMMGSRFGTKRFTARIRMQGNTTRPIASSSVPRTNSTSSPRKPQSRFHRARGRPSKRHLRKQADRPGGFYPGAHRGLCSG